MLRTFKLSSSCKIGQSFRRFADVSDARKLIEVTNLPKRISVEALKDHMWKIGPVKHCEIVETSKDGDRTGRVQFHRIACAEKSIRELHNSSWMGKKIIVQRSPVLLPDSVIHHTPKFPRSIDVNCSKLFLHNLAFDVTSQKLESFLKKLKIAAKSVRIIKNSSGKATGLGTVELSSTECADKAVKLIGSNLLHGRQVGVREDREELVDAAWKDREEQIAKQAEGFVPEGYERHSVFVGNLSMEVTSLLLSRYMSLVGPVIKASVLRGQKNFSLECGIVVYEKEQDARRAFTELHDSEFMGRLIYVREDRETSRAESVKRRKVATGPNPERSVYVGNLAWEVNSDKLKQHLQPAGEVKKVMLFEKDGRRLGNGVVEFVDKQGARNALAVLKGTTLFDRPLFIEPYVKQ